LRQFMMNTFDGLGSDSADKIMKAGEFGSRQSPGKLDLSDRERLHHCMRNVNVSDGQSMQVMRYANRVPLQFKTRDCAITQTIMQTNWRSYGLTQSRGSLPSGPVRLMVHMASVWVPFTSESKEAIASYDEIQKEMRLGLQAVGRKLGIFLRRRKKVKQEGERRSVFLRYLGEVATAVSELNGCDREDLLSNLHRVAKRVTKEADTKLDRSGKKVTEESEVDYGDNVLIVDADHEQNLITHLEKADPQKKLF
jgi:DNA topoisomerase-6 subunit B